MPEPNRLARAAALDDISDHLGAVLLRADELLAEWSAFGAAVRGQVEREAATVGEAVASAVDGAVARATAAGIDRAIADHVNARLTALAGELSRLEQQARAASRSLADQRTGDRRVLWLVAGGVLVANALLVAMLVREPPAAASVAEPARVELAPPPAAPSLSPVREGSAATDPATSPAPEPDPAGSASGPAQAGSASGRQPSRIAAPPRTPGVGSGAAPPGERQPGSPAAPPGERHPGSPAAPRGERHPGSPAAPSGERHPGSPAAPGGPGSTSTVKPIASAPARTSPVMLDASAPAVRVPSSAKLPPRRK